MIAGAVAARATATSSAILVMGAGTTVLAAFDELSGGTSQEIRAFRVQRADIP
jgi:hypothetical protein